MLLLRSHGSIQRSVVSGIYPSGGTGRVAGSDALGRGQYEDKEYMRFVGLYWVQRV